MHGKILILEDEPRMRRLLELVLGEEGHAVRSASDGQEGMKLWRQWRPDVVISDLKMPRADGLEVLQFRNRHFADTPFILLTAFGTVETAVAAMKQGAFDYLTKPVDHACLRELVLKALRTGRQTTQLDHSLIGSSKVMETLRHEIRLAAATDSSVLITGESGTGKELVARAIHALYQNGQGNFVRMNCPAIPGELLESELFGHRRGSFTGAFRDRQGAFVAADGGILFLDEIGDLPLSLQPKLLYAVEQKQITPIGSQSTRTVDVKIVAATNQNIQKMAMEGTFRQDLLYRLNTLQIHVPPLRERGNDVLELADHYLAYFREKFDRAHLVFDDAVPALLRAYDWPGNVRELKNIIERGCLRSEGEQFTAAVLPKAIQTSRKRDQEQDAYNHQKDNTHLDLRGRERQLIVEALRETNWNQSRAARMLGITRNTLRYRIKKFAIERE